MESKTCNQCGILKPFDKFAWAKKKDGSQYLRNVCRDCRNEKRRISVKKRENKEKNESPGVKMNPTVKINKTNTLEELDRKIIKLEQEIEGLKVKKTPRTSNSKLLTKSSRINKSIMINKHIHDYINKYAKDNNINYSDAINILLAYLLE